MKLFSRRTLSALAGIVVITAGTVYWWQGRVPSPEQRFKQQEAVVGDITQNVSANGTLSPIDAELILVTEQAGEVSGYPLHMSPDGLGVWRIDSM